MSAPISRCPRCSGLALTQVTDARHGPYRSCWLCGFIEETGLLSLEGDEHSSRDPVLIPGRRTKSPVAEPPE